MSQFGFYCTRQFENDHALDSSIDGAPFVLNWPVPGLHSPWSKRNEDQRSTTFKIVPLHSHSELGFLAMHEKLVRRMYKFYNVEL